MDTTTDKPRSRKEKSKQTEPLTSAVLVAVVFVMIVAVALRMGRPGSQGTCSYDATDLVAVCKGKGLSSVPSDVPDSVVTLQMGEVMDQGENHLTVLRRWNFTRFKNLRELVLVRCDIESILEEPFADLGQLSRIDLRFNRIQAISESSFRGLSNLEYILLSNNPIQVLGDNAFRGLRIQHLEFANNPLLSKISHRAFFESSISSLAFNRCNLKSMKPDTWSPLAKTLRRLQISDNLQPLDIKDEVFDGFQLESLVLTNDGITSTVFLKYGDYDEINLDRNPLENIKFCNSDRYSKKKHQKTTKRLSLAGTKISKIFRDTFSMFSNVEFLNLSSNYISLVDAEVLEELDQLKILDLSDNDLTEFVGNFSKVLPNLEMLLLDGNEIETIPSSTEPFFSKLVNLSLGGNPFHCNCEIRWLIRWLKKNAEKNQEQTIKFLACRTPEMKNFSQISEYDLKCRHPTILNATIDADGMTLVCTAEGEPAPVVTWISPFRENATTEPLKATRQVFQTKGRMTMIKDGNYTCIAENVAGQDHITVDTNSIPQNGMKFFSEGQEKLQILETPQGFLMAAALVGLLGYIFRHQ